MCKQLFCLSPQMESLVDENYSQLTSSSLKQFQLGGKAIAHRILENLLNLLFDTIEFSNNNLSDFLLALLAPREHTSS